MKKILLAVDNTKGSLKAAETCIKLFSGLNPEKVVLLYVKKMEGLSLMGDALMSVSEVNELKESMKGTDYQEKLDQAASKVTDHFKKLLEENGISGIQVVVREGHPADEILDAASAEGVELIVVGSRGKRLHNLFMGSVSREVANRSDIPVIIAK